MTEYADVISDAKFTQQRLDWLLADVRQGQRDAIVCFKLDQLGRSLAHSIPLGQRGISAVTNQACDQPFDADYSAGGDAISEMK